MASLGGTIPTFQIYISSKELANSSFLSKLNINIYIYIYVVHIKKHIYNFFGYKY